MNALINVLNSQSSPPKKRANKTEVTTTIEVSWRFSLAVGQVVLRISSLTPLKNLIILAYLVSLCKVILPQCLQNLRSSSRFVLVLLAVIE